MPLGTILRIVVAWLQSSNGICENVYHLRTVIGGVSLSTAQTDITNWLNVMYSQIKTIMPNTCVAQPAKLYMWVDGEGFVFQSSLAVTISGTAGIDVIPPMNAPLATIAALGGGVAKKYLPAVVETVQNNGELQSGGMANLTHFATNYVLGPNGIRYSNVTVQTNGEISISYNNLTNVAKVYSTIANQKRRKRGRGA